MNIDKNGRIILNIYSYVGNVLNSIATTCVLITLVIDDVTGSTFDGIVFLEEHLALLETVRQLPVVGLRQGDGLEAHDEGDGAEDEDGKDWVDLLQIGDERRHHGAQPGHGAGEGEGGGPDHGGEELVGVCVDDAPADGRDVLARHGQPDYGPLVRVLTL